MSEKIKKSLLILGPNKPSISTDMLIKEAEERFQKVVYAPIGKIVLHLSNDGANMFYGKIDLSKFDYCLPRIDSKRAHHGYHIIRMMDAIGMKKPYTAETILTAHNKYKTQETMQRAGVPIADSYLIDSISATSEVIRDVKYPIVAKIVDSFGGYGVMIFEDKDTARSTIQTLRLLKQQILIEEFIPNPGEDIRAFVVGDRIVAAMKRIAKKGEQRANLMQGGKAEKTELSDEMKKIAMQAAAASGSSIVAVDMIESKKGTKVIEININPGLKGITKATKVNVAKLIIDFICEEI
ncbi:MAG: RimK family alpha-L-glutamate ligase [Candidatus Aenigmarchaeota archaeon]|nr:RimK family alpha-L-glutamate ligase [Candidatus Aenigmarchaeota archaeon]